MWWHKALLFISVGVILIYSYIQWTRRKMYAMLANMSGPKALPVIGHAHKFYNVSPKGLARTVRYFARFPSPVCIHMGPLPHVCIFDPESLQVVLNSPHCLKKSHQYSFLWIPRTLLCAPVEMWKDQRKALNPSFGPAILGSFVPIFNQKSAILIKIFEQHVGKPPRDFCRDILKCTLDQIYKTAFECDFDMQLSPDGDRSMDLFESYMKLVSDRFFTVWKYPDFIYRWTRAFTNQQKYRKIYFDTVLEKIVRHVDIAKKINEPSSADVPSKMHNFIYCLTKYLRTQESVSNEDLLGHFSLMVFAGNETTAKTISSVLLMLAMNPDVQDRCFQEITDVCSGESDYVSAEDAANLNYVDMVCKETLRLFPVAPMLARIATSDIKLNDQQTIPENTRIVIGIHQVHRDPKIWGPNADRFDPDNFLPDSVARRHPYSYIPFSGGPRNCLGVRYAWLSMKILIAYILRKYRLDTSLKFDQLRVSFGLLLNIANGCQLTIHKR